MTKTRSAGYWALLILCLALPFEFTQKPIYQSSYFTLTNLKIIYYLVVVVAALTLALDVMGASRTGSFASLLAGRRIALACYAGLVVGSLISTALAIHRADGLKWTIDLIPGGILWLAIPSWLEDDRERRMGWIGAALVTGAVVAAVVGFLEFILGTHFADSLTWFKSKPTVTGSYLRLSGTFAYANVAAMYFELVIFFGVSILGLASGKRRFTPIFLVWAVATITLLTAQVLTFSRGALLGLGVGLFSTVLVTRTGLVRKSVNRSRALLPALFITVLLLAAGVIAVLGPRVAPLRLTVQSDLAFYQAGFSAHIPATLSTGREITVPVKLTNLSSLDWNATGHHPYHLGYHWLDRSDRVVVFDGYHNLLPANLPSGGAEVVQAEVVPPDRAGTYYLVWDMVQEQVAWFSLRTGIYQKHLVRVTGSPVARRNQLSRPPVTMLPVTPAEPDRTQLWRVAVRMIRARPLFGVGPDGYRLSFGQYTSPPQTQWDHRILANSLPLELFADLGFVGGGLFFAFLVSVGWPVVAWVYRGNVSSYWQLALIGAGAAFVTHGFVDYILGSHAILILFWIMAGIFSLAARPTRPACS
jgi:O-Antigen ligase